MSRDYIVNGYDILTKLPVGTGWMVSTSGSGFKRLRINPDAQGRTDTFRSKDWGTWAETIEAIPGIDWVTPKGIGMHGYWFDFEQVKGLALTNQKGNKITWTHGRPCEVGQRGDWSTDTCGRVAVEEIPYGGLWMQEQAKNTKWVCSLHRGVQKRRQAHADERRANRDAAHERNQVASAAHRASDDWAERLASVGVEAEGAAIQQGGNWLTRCRISPETLYAQIEDVIGMLRDIGIEDHPFQPIEHKPEPSLDEDDLEWVDE